MVFVFDLTLGTEQTDGLTDGQTNGEDMV